MSDFYIGLMSGTSMDAVDAVLVDFSTNNTHNELCNIIAHSCTNFPSTLHRDISALITNSETTLEKLGEIDVKLAELYATAVNELLSTTTLSAVDIKAIGCHGQTVFHQPEGKYRFSTQLGSASYLVESTRISVVNDFRNRDMAAGGQGAPLVPAFHQAFFKSQSKSRLIINIGGISNCTWLPPSGKVEGFDIGPGNTLMDCWIRQCLQKSYDENGHWAAQGEVSSSLLNAMQSDPYLQKSAPKSTGREYFNLKWLETYLQIDRFSSLSKEDIQATLLQLSAITITETINHYSPDETYLCGGGVFNKQLVHQINTLSQHALFDINDLGINADFVEAAAFAWLAKQCLERKKSTISTVTGAHEDVIAGAIYLV